LADVLLDSYYADWEYARQVQAVHPSTSGYNSAIGHCFHHTEANNHKLKSVHLWLRRNGVINGTVRVDLFAITGTCGSTGKPVGTRLTSSALMSTKLIGTAAYVEKTFTFTVMEPYELVPNVKYVFALIGVSGTYSGSQYIMVKFSGSGGTDDGNDCFYTYYYPDWGTFASGDLYFEVWGEEVVAAKVRAGLNIPQILPLILDG